MAWDEITRSVPDRSPGERFGRPNRSRQGIRVQSPGDAAAKGAPALRVSGRLKSVSARTVSSESGLPVRWRKGWPESSPASGRRMIELGIKRALDIVLGLWALIAISPVLAAIAVAIAITSPGPVLYTQVRHGRSGRPFRIYKFRSMRLEGCDATGTRQAVRDDPRVSPVGRFLRRTSLDELPQLINVIKGDMSLVGPRPHPIGMLAGGHPYEEVVPWYAERLAMRPGLSGWAQVNGLRGPTQEVARARARIAHDIAYIQNYSLLLDIRIIWLTLREIFRSTGS